ncbi:hypothetical protein Q5762_17460 [Streptomyces sp. P9(2023)]|uniref:hypothetical protein n=1 Tax=Streptomyces sp. P9(2023) TaxID=3064394 RepID=UPI0028F41D39|nr:hypothetical protein [Streptomyces sp. P9(2023)]MDT9690092.1 hypothetical protein [Streptomyces sp. P9(2023)]
MNVNVKALATSTLTAEAIRDLLALPTMAPVPDDRILDHGTDVLGWGFTQLVCDAERTRHDHVLSYNVDNPMGDGTATLNLVFAEACPYDPDGENNVDWLTGDVRGWADELGWTFRTDVPLDTCESELAEASATVSEVLGHPPVRTVRTDDWFGMGPFALCRIWRTGDHAVVVSPLADHGPYGYLTHFVLVLTPCPADEELPADDAALRKWVVDRIDW